MGPPGGARGKRLSAFAEYFFGGGADHCSDCVKLCRPCAIGQPNNGQFCPRVINEPQTAEGRVALRLALSPGVWRRAGLDGGMCGVDWAGARALAEGMIPRRLWPLVARLLARFETGAVLGDSKRRKQDKEED